jgi:hypothetical protein
MRQHVRAISPHDDGRIVGLFRCGLDTVEIARKLGFLEWQVANRLLHARQPKFLVGSIVGDPPPGRSALDRKTRGED